MTIKDYLAEHLRGYWIGDQYIHTALARLDYQPHNMGCPASDYSLTRRLELCRAAREQCAYVMPLNSTGIVRLRKEMRTYGTTAAKGQLCGIVRGAAHGIPAEITRRGDVAAYVLPADVVDALRSYIRTRSEDLRRVGLGLPRSMADFVSLFAGGE